MSLRSDILTTVSIFADEEVIKEADVVERLVELGHNRLRAEILVAFVPLGFGRAVIARMQLKLPIKLSTTALILNSSEKDHVSVRLSEVPEFEAARQLAEECFEGNIISQKAFTATCSVGVELKLISDALTAGEDVSGGEMAPPILLRLPDAPGFNEWQQELKGSSLERGL